jgi:hypothetical protein
MFNFLIFYIALRTLFVVCCLELFAQKEASHFAVFAFLCSNGGECELCYDICCMLCYVCTETLGSEPLRGFCLCLFVFKWYKLCYAMQFAKTLLRCGHHVF